jgi:hypothetical protein
VRGADFQNKWSRLTASDGNFRIDKTLQSQVEKLADVNHRLLEELYKKLRDLQKPNIDKSFISNGSIYDSLKDELSNLVEQIFKEQLRNQIRS